MSLRLGRTASLPVDLLPVVLLPVDLLPVERRRPHKLSGTAKPGPA